MAKLDNIAVKGCKVLEDLGHDKFKIEMPNGHILTCYISGKIRKHFIRILPLDIVTIEIPPQDFNNGRIIYREKTNG